MTTTTSFVLIHSPARSAPVRPVPTPTGMSVARKLTLALLLAVTVLGGLAFNRWLTYASTVPVTPTSCVDGEASTAAAYRARTEAVVHVGSETQVAGVVICR